MLEKGIFSLIDLFLEIHDERGDPMGDIFINFPGEINKFPPVFSRSDSGDMNVVHSCFLGNFFYFNRYRSFYPMGTSPWTSPGFTLKEKYATKESIHSGYSGLSTSRVF
jgi:hypothetical protein